MSVPPVPPQNPYGPPQSPSVTTAYAHVQPGHPQQWNAPQSFPPQSFPGQSFQAQAFQAPPRQGNGLAVTAVVMSGLALLAVVIMALLFFVGGAMAPSLVLQGEVGVSGSTVGADALEQALTEIVEDDGGFVDEIVCPDSSAVGQGLVTVCHGGVDGYDWTGVVVFEDAEGAFMVNQL